MMSELKRFRYWPEVVSLLAGVVVPYLAEIFFDRFLWQHLRQFWWGWPSTAFIAFIAFMTFASTTLCAFLYFLNKRLNMWKHILFYVSGWLCFRLLYIFFFEMWFGIVWEAFVAVAGALLLAAIPASPVCYFYSILFAKRFTKTTTQGGENL